MFVYVYCFASVINMYITEPTNRQPEKIERPQLCSPERERARASQCHKNCMHAEGMRGKERRRRHFICFEFLISLLYWAHVGKVRRKVSYEPWRVAKAAWALHKRQKAELIRTNDHPRYIGEEKTMWIGLRLHVRWAKKWSLFKINIGVSWIWNKKFVRLHIQLLDVGEKCWNTHEIYNLIQHAFAL